MTSDQEEATLEANVGRLFGSLEKKAGVSESDRARILERLVQEASASRALPAAGRGRRRARWVGMAAGLVLATGALSVGWFGSQEPAGAPGSPTGSGTTLARFAIHLLAAGPGLGVVEAASPEDGETLYVHSERHVSEADVQSASVEPADAGCRVGIRLTTHGTRKLADLTRDHVGERLALVIDGQVVMSPTIRSEISQGLVVLTGDFSDARCEEIARGLSGSG